MIMRREHLNKLILTGVFAALSYVVFTFLQVKISLPGGGATSIHLGNAVCVLGALMLGGVWGGLGGALGMTIGDLLDPVYVLTAPKTFILKLCIGLITGFVAHRLGKIQQSKDRRHVFTWSVIASVSGLLFNIIFDPLFSYFYQRIILGEASAKLAFAVNLASTSINAVLSVLVAVFVYMALQPALQRKLIRL